MKIEIWYEVHYWKKDKEETIVYFDDEKESTEFIANTKKIARKIQLIKITEELLSEYKQD